MSNGSPRMSRARRVIPALLFVILYGINADSVLASSACLDPGSGIGGTGRAPEGSGVGGTGAPMTRGETESGTPSRTGLDVGGIGRSGEGSGVGGTGISAKGSGVGGTGVSAEASGVGGTGIVGTITGFASICVNGVEIHYAADTPVDINGQSAKVADLALGQVVAVEAVGAGAEVAARRISVVHAVTGPLSRIDVNQGEAEVLGQKIELTGRTVIAGHSRSTRGEQSLKAGDFVQVSGLRRRDGTIVTSRVERTSPRAEVSISGPVTEIEPGGFRIFGLRVEPASGNLPSELAAGRTVRASGTFEQARLRTERLRLEPRVPFGGRVEHLELQGYIHERPNDNTFLIGDLRVEVSRETRIRDGDASELVNDRRVRISGRLTPDQRVHAERIDIERRDHRIDGRRGPERHGRSDDHRGRGRGSGRDHGDRSGPSRPDRPDRIDRSGPNRGSDMERPDRYERVERNEYERPERLDRSGRH